MERHNEEKKWEKPTLTVVSTLDTDESVLVTQSGSPFDSIPNNDQPHP